MLTYNTDKYMDYAPLLLRIVVGLIFIVSGWNKLTGIEGTAGFFGGLGIPMPVVMAWVVAIVELAGGLMILLGFKMQLPNLLLVIVMVVAIVTVKLGADNPFRAMRLELMLIVANLSLFITGPGKYSLDDRMGGKSA